MSANSPYGLKDGITWLVWRNPLYLLSAACMAVGARLYLVHPGTPAGDVGAILLTLGVLQLYECLVMAILLLLHRYRRSPEDEGSLLLVAALFWTGPLAATIEMSVSRPNSSLLCALAALIFAAAELWTVRRWLGLHLGRAAQALAMGCFVLLMLAPTFVRVPDAADELRLYACWWLLAGMALLSIPAIRGATASRGRSDAAGRSGVAAEGPRASGAAGVVPGAAAEVLFVLILLGVTAAQLWGMNYAFCGHARLFYAGPLLVVVSWAAFEYVARVASRKMLPRLLAAVPALLAVALTAQDFDSAVPTAQLPRCLRDPLSTMLALSALAMWAGAWRNRSAGLLHTGTLAFALAVVRARMVFWPPIAAAPAGPAAAVDVRGMLTLALLALAVYLMLSAIARRSRVEAIVGLIISVAAATVWSLGRPGSPLIIASAACWSCLIAVHLGGRWPRMALVLWPVCALLVLAWCYELRPGWHWMGRANVGALAGVLLAVGVLPRTRRYAVLGLAVLAAEGAFYASAAVAAGRMPVALLVVLGAFALLLSGAVVSWHKGRLLALAAGVGAAQRKPPATACESASAAGAAAPVAPEATAPPPLS